MGEAVVLTASEGSFPGLVDELRRLRVAVEERPLMRFAPPLDWAPVDRAMAKLTKYDAIAFTSPRAARAFADRVLTARAQGLLPDDLPLWAGGPGTAAALKGLGAVQSPDERAVGRHGAAGALSRALLGSEVRGPVLFPCGDHRRDELPARLRDDGIEVEEVVCYRSVLAAPAEARTAAERAAVLVVGSPSVADLLARVCPVGVRPRLLAVGPTTATAARVSGWPPSAVASRPTAAALASSVRALLAGDR